MSIGGAWIKIMTFFMRIAKKFINAMIIFELLLLNLYVYAMLKKTLKIAHQIIHFTITHPSLAAFYTHMYY